MDPIWLLIWTATITWSPTEFVTLKDRFNDMTFLQDQYTIEQRFKICASTPEALNWITGMSDTATPKGFNFQIVKGEVFRNQ